MTTTSLRLLSLRLLSLGQFSLRLLSLRLFSLALLLLTARMAPAGAQTEAGAGPTAAPALAAPAAPAPDAAGTTGLQVRCVRVLDRRGGAVAAAEKAADSCAGQGGGALVGAGDVIVGLSPASFAYLRAYERRNNTHPSLYVNGVALGDDARLVSIVQHPDGVFMRYNIVPGDKSKVLWSALYRTAATAARHPLSAAIGFENGPTSDTVAAAPLEIAITSPDAYRAGVLLVAALVVAGLVLGYATNIFRGAGLPPPLRAAAAMKRKAARERIADPDAVLALDPAYTDAQAPAYAADAQAVLDGADPAAVTPARLAAGLFLLRGRWTTLKSSYSLGRVQLGLWTLFAVAAGAYLWAIYGDLPDIEGSLLMLLGLSAATTTLSLATDQDNPNVRFSLSQGFFTDLVTGWDDRQQLHRFQSVVVNLLLLIVGAVHVYTQLSYPIFNPNWLTLLGISGLGLAAGKKYVETQPVASAQPAQAPPAPPGVGGAGAGAAQPAAQPIPGVPPTIPVVARGLRRATDQAPA